MTRTARAPLGRRGGRALHRAHRVLVGALILAVVLALYVFVLTRGAIL